MSDITNIADSVGDSMKKGASAIKATAEEKVRQYELKTLQPIFVDDLDRCEFFLSNSFE